MTDRKDINMASGKRPGCIVLVVVALILGVPPYALAAAQTISGYVQYPDLRRSVRVTVTLRDQEGHRVASTVTNEAGAFVLVAPQAGTFSVQARQAISQSATVVLAVGHTPPEPVVLTMKDTEALTLEIVAPHYHTNPRSSGETLSISRKDIEALPKGNNLDLNDVLATIPGAVNGSLKQVHIRQEHANLQFRIDGVPIPDTVTTQFTDLIHPRTWKRADIRLGGMEAQYGNRTAAVIDITSKSGTTPGFGSFQASGGSNETGQPSFEYGGTVGGKFRWYVMNNYLTTNRGIDPPTLGQSVHHDHSERNQTYLRGDYQLSNRHNVTWLFLNSVASYQIPTQPGRESNRDIVALIRNHTDPQFRPKPSEAIDENQDEHNLYSHLVWRYDMSASRFLSVAGYARHSRATFKTDPYHSLAYADDTDEPFSAGHQDRWGVAGGVRIDYTHAFSKQHVLKTGFQFDRTTTTNKTRLFVFALERDEHEEEEEEDEHAHERELEDGGVLARHGDQRLIGYREEFWVQDQFTPHEQWTVNVGLRLDHIHGYIDATQVSPRIGIAFALNDRHTFRAFYGRLFTPPNLEAIPLQALNTAGTTAESENPTNNKTNPERSHAFEIGSTHAIGDAAVLQLTGYYKLNTNQADAHQFGTTPMLNYFAYQRGWQRGIEGTLRAKLADGLVAQGNVAWGQCKGKGLQSGHFLLHEEELADIETSEGVFCDHMQTLTSYAVVTYHPLPQTTISWQMLYGSGLRRHAPGAKTNSGHADSHTTYNVSVTHTIPLKNQHKLLLGVDMINILDQHEWVNIGEQSIGLGVSHANMPRSIFFRTQWLF